MSDRKCAGTTKKGDPCKAAPLTDTDFCLAHSDEETRGETGFGGPQPGSGVPARPKPSEIAKRLIEANELALQRPYWLTLGYDVVIGENGPELVERATGGAKLYGTSKDGYVQVSPHDDLEAMQRAAERLQDRVYGKPKQQTEVTGAEGGPVQVVSIAPDPDRARSIAELLQQQGAVGDQRDG